MGCDWNALGLLSLKSMCECARGRKRAFWGVGICYHSQKLLELWVDCSLGFKSLNVWVPRSRHFHPGNFQIPTGGSDLTGWINNLQDSSPKFSAANPPPPKLMVVGKGCQFDRFSLGDLDLSGSCRPSPLFPCCASLQP